MAVCPWAGDLTEQVTPLVSSYQPRSSLKHCRCCSCVIPAGSVLSSPLLISCLPLAQEDGLIPAIRTQLALQHCLYLAGEPILAAACKLSPFCCLDGFGELLLPQPKQYDQIPGVPRASICPHPGTRSCSLLGLEPRTET